MTLEEYIQSLIDQGLTENEMIPLIMQFEDNNGQIPEQTTDENFQQDGVAGADAPSEFAAPELSLIHI